MSKKKVVLIEPVLAHYRRDVFKIFLQSKDFYFKIIAGDYYNGVKGIEDLNQNVLKFKHFSIRKHNFYYLKGIIKYLSEIKPDIIICTGIDLHLSHTIFIHFLYRIIYKKPFYWWSHANQGNQGKLGVWLRSFFYKRSSGIFVYNKKGRENLIQMGVENNKIQVVNNSLNINDYGYLNYTLPKEFKNKPFTILYSGRLTKEKKINILIKALGIIKNKEVEFKCNIIGGGDKISLDELMSENNVKEYVHFIGAKYGKDVHSYFLESDLFVYPGGIGLSILHAMSFGLFTITSDNLLEHGPEIELLEIKKTGDFYTNNSPENLADKILYWRKHITENRKNYIDNCIEKIKCMEYLPDLMSKKVLDFLKMNECNE